MKFANIFVEKMQSFSHFFNKNISVFAYKVVKHLRSWPLNELVKLTLLWTTVPRCINTSLIGFTKNYILVVTFNKVRFSFTSSYLFSLILLAEFFTFHYDRFTFWTVYWYFILFKYQGNLFSVFQQKFVFSIKSDWSRFYGSLFVDFVLFMFYY